MFLERILDHKKAELRHKASRSYLAELKNRIADRQPPRGFLQALQTASSETAPALIAEVKKASPSQGLMRPEFADRFDPAAIGRAYAECGAAAISVLTDRKFFQGSLDDLAAVNDAVVLPLLNKEFMIHDIQFYEARAFGADGVLLIVAALERNQLMDLFSVAQGLGLDVLIETHHEREVDLVLERLPDAGLIGINNRDLKTFSTDLAVTRRVAMRIPRDRFVVSESGLHTRDDVVRILESGAKGMLIGESLLRADNMRQKIQDLLGREACTDEVLESQKSSVRWI